MKNDGCSNSDKYVVFPGICNYIKSVRDKKRNLQPPCGKFIATVQPHLSYHVVCLYVSGFL